MRSLSLALGIFIASISLNARAGNTTDMPTNCQMCRNLKCVILCMGLWD